MSECKTAYRGVPQLCLEEVSAMHLPRVVPEVVQHSGSVLAPFPAAVVTLRPVNLRSLVRIQWRMITPADTQLLLLLQMECNSSPATVAASTLLRTATITAAVSFIEQRYGEVPATSKQ